MNKNLLIRVGWAFISPPKEGTLYRMLVGTPVERRPMKIEKNLSDQYLPFAVQFKYNTL
jgi:hypothetical protein